MARIPRARRDMLYTDLGIFLVPYLVQAVLVEQNRHIQRVPRGEREVATEHGDFGRRGHRIVVRLHGIDRSGLHRPEQLTRRDQRVGCVKLDLHPVARDLVEHVDCRLHHMFGQCGACIGLHPPCDRGLREGRGGQRGGGGRGPGDELASGGHVSLLVGLLRSQGLADAPFTEF